MQVASEKIFLGLICFIIIAVFIGCSDFSGEYYTYEMYSISNSTFSSLQSHKWDSSIAPLTYTKSQGGTSLVNSGYGQTDDIRQLLLDLNLSRSFVNKYKREIKRNGSVSLWFEAGSGHRFIYCVEEQ